MAKAPEKAKKPEKSQEELREALELKLKSLKPTLEDGIKLYEEELESGVYEDQAGELVGTGEKRQEAMQAKLTAILRDWALEAPDDQERKDALSGFGEKVG